MSKSKILNLNKVRLFGVEMVFLDFHNYYEVIEDSMAAKFQERSLSYVEFLKQGTEKVLDRDYSNYLDQQHCEGLSEMGYNFPNIFRASFFVQVISFIEFELKELCMFHEEQNKSLIKFSDLKGADEFEKIKKYLKGSGNIDFSLLDPEWGHIKKMKILRNRFVHHYGTIDKEDRDRYRTILEIVNSEKSITFMENSLRDKKIDDFDSLTLVIADKEFNVILLKQAESLFQKILTLFRL